MRIFFPVFACLVTACQPGDSSGDHTGVDDAATVSDVVDVETLPRGFLGRWVLTTPVSDDAPTALQFTTSGVVQDLAQFSADGSANLRRYEISSIRWRPGPPPTYYFTLYPMDFLPIEVIDRQICITESMTLRGQRPKMLACYRKSTVPEESDHKA